MHETFVKTARLTFVPHATLTCANLPLCSPVEDASAGVYGEVLWSTKSK